MANALTMFRLLIVPVFVYVLAGSAEGHSTVAGILLLAASVSDWLDGQIARRTRTVTEFGTFADPLADRLLIAGALLILLAKHALPQAAVMMVLLRDAYVLAGYWVLARRDIHVPVILLGKISTALLLVALVTAVFGWSRAEWLFWSGAVVSLLSAIAYTRLGVRQFRRPRPRVAETRQGSGSLGGSE